MKQAEEWREISGYEGRYLVSNRGRVKSLLGRKDRILKPGTNTSGYLYVSILKNKIPKNFLVHRLVALHFIPNPESKEQVNHSDGVKKNNLASNLEWNTYRENYNHALRNKLMPKERHGTTRLFTDDEVKTYRRLHQKDKKEFSIKNIAMYINANPITLQKCISRQTYKHV
ncbi:NUMOD4 domain-containing protein [Sutcliffiella horikoshii]|uniref:NUMOD4 domain-containing protein n=1 Tax=Sutcliffiella horikoshii TaxID=79883 RepID=UPI001F2CD2C6|nr:NUMOD4 domain-containing protein [Sutcliffiella horikoshii]